MEFFNGEIVICGGQNTKQECRALNKKQIFVPHSELNKPRVHHSSAIISNLILIVGGVPDTAEEDFTAESLEGSQWANHNWNFDELKGMPAGSCMAAISKDTLIMAGGGTEFNGKTHSSQVFKYYKVDKDWDGLWEQQQDYPGPGRSEHGCAFIKTPEGEAFLIAGGYSGENTYLKSSYLYNIEKKAWEEVGELSVFRRSGRMVVVGGRILMMGGSYVAGTTVEEFNTESKTWNVIGQELKRPRGQFAAVAVPGNMVGC